MSIQCTNCGRILAKDNARFCSNCGTFVSTPAHPHSPQAVSSPKDLRASSAGQTDKNKSTLREQIAQQPPLTKKENELLAPAQLDAPVAESGSPPPKSPRELHVKVWEQQEIHSAALPEKPVPATVKEEKAAVEEKKHILGDFPTMPLVVEQADGQTRHATMPPAILGVQTPRFYTSTPSFAQPAVPPAQEPRWSQQPSSSPFVPPARPVRRPKSRVPLLFSIMLLCLLVVGGLWAWIYVFQPFSVPQVTQPQRSFQNASLGVSLSYPNGWTVQLDQNNGTAHFSDSTHTAQFSVVVVATNRRDAGRYLLQEAKQLGMAGAKPGPPLSFGKATWQQVQSSVVQDGANYTQTLLVTTHANRLYSVIQQAPQATYTDEEQVIFSTMRSSFQFLL